MNNGNPVHVQVESPRLPFRDWVHGIKFSNGGETEEAKGISTPGQRDSGLALQCDLCCMDPCQCVGCCYADQLSAFMTPAVMGPGQGVGGQPGPMAMLSANPYGGMVTSAKAGMYEADNGDTDWAAHYGGPMMSADGPLTAPPNGGMGTLGQLSEAHEEEV